MPHGLRVLAVTLAALVGVAGCGGETGNYSSAGQAVPAEEPAPSTSPTPSVAPSTTAAPSAQPGVAAATTTATPSRFPVPPRKPDMALPPAPRRPAPSASTTCPSYSGPKAPLADVRDALTAAGTTAYWVPVQDKPEGYPGDGSEITVPVDLMKAIAWQESGWQSTIIACDGGIGTMQVMPDTATWMNQRFKTSHDVNTLAGNTALGAEYLEWLIMYFGLYYYGTFDLYAPAPPRVGPADMRLIDVVIAAYNVGYGAVENPDGTSLSIPNQWYVDNVLALMTNCECQKY